MTGLGWEVSTRSTGSIALMSGSSSSGLEGDKTGGGQCCPRSYSEGRMSPWVVILEVTMNLELTCDIQTGRITGSSGEC